MPTTIPYAATSDLNYLRQRYWGLGTFPTCSASVTAACFQRVNQGGTASGFTNSNQSKADRLGDRDGHWTSQAAHLTCLNCKILLVEAYSDAPGDLATSVNVAAQLGATEISNSYGWAESGLATWYPSAYNHRGHRDHGQRARPRLRRLLPGRSQHRRRGGRDGAATEHKRLVSE